jgi:hypothetical protein
VSVISGPRIHRRPATPHRRAALRVITLSPGVLPGIDGLPFPHSGCALEGHGGSGPATLWARQRVTKFLRGQARYTRAGGINGQPGTNHDISGAKASLIARNRMPPNEIRPEIHIPDFPAIVFLLHR